MFQAIPLDQSVVVVIEDNADTLLIVQQLLRKVGVQHVIGCMCGEEFFGFLSTVPNPSIDLILLDIQIPNEDGYAILQQIRAIPQLANTRVVAVTANVMTEHVLRAESTGFDGFLGKPLTPERFPQQIVRIFASEAVWEPHYQCTNPESSFNSPEPGERGFSMIFDYYHDSLMIKVTRI